VKTVKLHDSNYLALEELRVFLLKRRGKNVTKAELLGTLIDIYRKKMTEAYEGSN
jgi:hypothetical protein